MTGRENDKLTPLIEPSDCYGGTSTAGRSVWSPKGTTLRVIRCPTLQVSQFLFPGQRSDTFLTDHVNDAKNFPTSGRNFVIPSSENATYFANGDIRPPPKCVRLPSA